jgi:hypothetical protein
MELKLKTWAVADCWDRNDEGAFCPFQASLNSKYRFFRVGEVDGARSRVEQKQENRGRRQKCGGRRESRGYQMPPKA